MKDDPLIKELMRLEEERRKLLSDPLISQKLADATRADELMKQRFADAIRPDQRLADAARADERRRQTLADSARIDELIKPISGQVNLAASRGMSSIFEEHRSSMRSLAETLRKQDISTSLLDSTSLDRKFFDSSAVRTGGISIQQLLDGPSLLEDKARSLQLDLKKTSLASSISAFLPNQKEMFSTLSALAPKWPGIEIPRESLTGITGLMSLHNAVDKNPFGLLESNALKSLLGTWDHIKLSEFVLNDWQSRKQFYLDRGFDARLTDIPNRLYDVTLFQSGLLRRELFSPVFQGELDNVQPVDEEESVTDTDEAQVFKERHSKAFDILFNLEIKLRLFIAEVMETTVGEKWIKQRVPGDVYQDWKRKREIALQKKEVEQAIIHYADFTDYEKIITRKDNWSEVFASRFVNMMDVQVSFQRLYVVRICTMHMRAITKEDFLMLTAESTRILKAIGKLD